MRPFNLLWLVIETVQYRDEEPAESEIASRGDLAQHKVTDPDACSVDELTEAF